MARNSSGTHSLPAGNPVVSGTVISSTVHNNTMGDISTEITDSLSRSGKGGMLAALRTVDGTVAAPAHSFTSETGTGLYRIGASNPGFAVAGSKRQEWSTTGTTVTGTATVTSDLTVQGTTGLTLTQGDVVMSEAATQSVTKSGGVLAVGTSDANDLHLRSDGHSRWVVSASDGSLNAQTSDGGNKLVRGVADPTSAQDAATKNYVDAGQTNTAFTGKPTATATVSGDGSTTLTTKGYVEGISDGTASISMGTGWLTTSDARLVKAINGLVVLNLRTTLDSGTGTTICTLPAGYRPTTLVLIPLLDATSNAYVFTTITTAGVVQIQTGTPTTGHQFYGAVTFNTTI